MFVVCDFDGTLTDAEAEGAPFVTGYLEDLALLTGTLPDAPAFVAAVDAARAELAARPHDFPFYWMGRAVAPASVDPYLRMLPIAERVFAAAGAFEKPDDRSRLLGRILYKYNYQKTLGRPHFRDGVGDVVRALPRERAFVVTNSDTDAVAGKIRALGEVEQDVAWLGKHVHGHARKFELDDAWADVPAELHVPGLARPVLLRRRAYFDVLSRVVPDLAKCVVVGDIFELDLAMPLAMGARVVLVASAHTPAYERAFVGSHPRGLVVDSLRELPAWLQALRA